VHSSDTLRCAAVLNRSWRKGLRIYALQMTRGMGRNQRRILDMTPSDHMALQNADRGGGT
jgi:hypothetical protein